MSPGVRPPTRLSWSLPGPASGRARRCCGPLRKPALHPSCRGRCLGRPPFAKSHLPDPTQGAPPQFCVGSIRVLLAYYSAQTIADFSGPAVTPPASVVRSWPASKRLRRKPAQRPLSSLPARDTNAHTAVLAAVRTMPAVLSTAGHAALGLMRLVAGFRGLRLRRKGTAV